jgi:predicted dehydrogenase
MKVGVVGCGSIGRRYVEWLSELDVELAIFDVNKTVLNEIIKNNTKINIFNSYEEFLFWKPEKVIISTPPLHHIDPAISALKNGADLLIEKPLAADIVDADKIIAQANKGRGEVWGVCNMRFHPGVQAVAGALGDIGRPLCVRAHFSHRLSQMRPVGVDVYAASTKEGGGVILDCIHEFDYLQWLLGPLKKIRGWCDQIGDDKIQADDVADIEMEFSSGCRGIIHFDLKSLVQMQQLFGRVQLEILKAVKSLSVTMKGLRFYIRVIQLMVLHLIKKC